MQKFNCKCWRCLSNYLQGKSSRYFSSLNACRVIVEALFCSKVHHLINPTDFTIDGCCLAGCISNAFIKVLFAIWHDKGSGFQITTLKALFGYVIIIFIQDLRQAFQKLVLRSSSRCALEMACLLKHDNLRRNCDFFAWYIVLIKFSSFRSCAASKAHS